MSNLSNDADWKKLYNLVDDLSKRQDCGKQQSTLYNDILTTPATASIFLFL